MNKIKMYFTKLILIVSCIVSFTQVYAQQTKKEIEKANKEFIKKFKKENKFKSVSVEVASDGYWYYSIYKSKKYGVATKDGKIIIPPIHKTPLEYYPACKEGYIQRYSDTIWVQKTNPVFMERCIHPNKKTLKWSFTLYDLNGNILIPTSSYDDVTVVASYVKLSRGRDLLSRKTGLHALDGKMILPIDYSYFSFNGKLLFTHKNIGTKYYHGALFLDNIADSIPCVFDQIEYNRNKECFMVIDARDYGNWKEYDRNAFFVNQTRDEGVNLYLAEKYDDVINYYSKAGVDKPWSKFYSGMAMIKQATPLYLDLTTFNQFYSQGRIEENTGIGTTWREYYASRNLNINVIKQLFSTGITLLEAYLAVDSTFREQASKELSTSYIFLNSLIDSTEVYQNNWDNFIKYNTLVENEKARQKRIQQEKQNAVFTAILGGFLNGLSNALINTSSTTAKKSYSTPVKAFSGSHSSASTKSSSSSSSSSTSVREKRKEKCRACQGTGLWIDERISGDLKWCDRCGKARKPHTHKTCGSCKGTGYK